MRLEFVIECDMCHLEAEGVKQLDGMYVCSECRKGISSAKTIQ